MNTFIRPIKTVRQTERQSSWRHTGCLQTSLFCDEFDSQNDASISGWAGKPADELAAELYSGDLLLAGGPAVYNVQFRRHQRLSGVPHSAAGTVQVSSFTCSAWRACTLHLASRRAMYTL